MNFDETLRGVIDGRFKPYTNLDNIAPETLTRLADFGVMNAGYAIGPIESLRLHDEVQRWIHNSVAEKRLNASFLDTTTIYTVNALINSPDQNEFLLPETLLDLSTFVNAAVLYDHIFHLENPGIDSLSLNEALGNQPVLITLPVENFDGERDFYGHVSGPGALLVAMWDEATSYNEALRNAAAGDAPSVDLEEILKGWGIMLGRRVTRSELFTEYSTKHWSSYGEALLNKLIRETRMRESDYSGVAIHSEHTAEFVEECNRRSMFNLQVSHFLELPYLPSAARLPFHRFLYQRAQIIQGHLATIKRIDEEYARMAETYFAPNSTNLVMPFFLNAVLAKISSLSEFFEELAEVRRKVEPLRKSRAELDAALSSGDIKAARKLRAAFEQDAGELRIKFPYAPVAGAIAAVLAAVGATIPSVALIAIGLLTAGSQMQPDIAKLRRRALNRRYWVLADMNDTASALTNALPKITQLWGSPRIANANDFPSRFARLRSLGYA